MWGATNKRRREGKVLSYNYMHTPYSPNLFLLGSRFYVRCKWFRPKDNHVWCNPAIKVDLNFAFALGECMGGADRSSHSLTPQIRGWRKERSQVDSMHSSKLGTTKLISVTTPPPPASPFPLHRRPDKRLALPFAHPPTSRSTRLGFRTLFKLEVFNALQTQIGPSLYLSRNTTLQNATPYRNWRRHLKSSVKFARHKNQQA